MAINPVNYMIQSADPLSKGIEGYGQMLSLRGAQNQLKQQAFAQAQAQAQAKRQEQLRADMATYAQNPTMEGIQKLRATYPEAKALDKIFESKTEEQKRNTANRALELIAIIDSGKTDILKSELTSEIEALDKRGQVEDARRKRTLIKLLDTENNIGLSSIKSALLAEGEAATGGKFSDMYKAETARTEGQQGVVLKERELLLKDRELTQKQENDLTAKLQAMSKNIKDEQTRIQSQENLLFKQFDPKVTKFNEIVNAKNKIQASLNKNNSTGDLAGIFAFMKVLDPGSVVREGEFQNAEKSIGLLQKVGIYPNKLLKGDKLTKKARKQFIETARNLFSTEKKAFERDYNRFNKMVDNQGLDPINIFGTLQPDTLDFDISLEGATEKKQISDNYQQIGKYKVRVK